MPRFEVALTVLLLGLASIGAGQNGPPKIPKQTDGYNRARLEITKPTYELARVESLIARIHVQKDSDFGTAAVTKAQFSRLSTEAKFTYCMIYGEQFSQNCDGMPAVLGEEAMIFAQPAGAFNEEEDWSPRQTHFLHAHRSEVIRLLAETIKANQRVGVNLKKAVLEINAVELIPLLEAEYKTNHRDLDILSTLCVLMKHGKYRPFIHTPVFRNLYLKEHANYQTSIPATEANRSLILSKAMGFYRSGKE